MSNHPYESIGKWCVEYKQYGTRGYYIEILESFEDCISLAKHIYQTQDDMMIKIKKYQNPRWTGWSWA